MNEALDHPHERLEWARRRAGFTSKAAFATAIGMPPVTYRAYELGQNGFAKFAPAFGRKLGVSADWLIDGGPLPDGEVPTKLPLAPDDEDDEPDMVGIQHADMAFGLGATFTDNPVEVAVLQFPKAWVQSITYSPPALLTWAKGRGESMAPTINDGDMVLLDRSQTKVAEQDALWAYTVGDVAAIKRLRVKGDRYQILSDNPSVPPDEEPMDLLIVVARVIFVGRKM